MPTTLEHSVACTLKAYGTCVVSFSCSIWICFLTVVIAILPCSSCCSSVLFNRPYTLPAKQVAASRLIKHKEQCRCSLCFITVSAGLQDHEACAVQGLVIVIDEVVEGPCSGNLAAISCWHYGLLIAVTEHKHSADVKLLKNVLRVLNTDSQAYAYDRAEWQLRDVEVCSYILYTA